jgi:hypothetical protein
MSNLARFVVVMATTFLATQPAFGSEPEATSGTANAVQALAFDIASHPQAEAVDLYKFLHQAMFGPGHAVPDSAQAAAALHSELADLGPPMSSESWCDTLGGDPMLVRVNLRPFVANGFSSDALVEAFVATASAVRADPQQMGVALDLVVQWLQTDSRQDLGRDLQELARTMAKEGYPPVHHSAAYRQAYEPAYRVIQASIASTSGWCGSF